MTAAMVEGQGGLRSRLENLISVLESGLVERRQMVRLCLLAALAGEHSLLIGPPGTAKSELARRLHTAFRGGRYFERLLTRFSVPEELFGPLSIRALEEDRYERQTAGFLPDASIAFIDEVFKANSAILNALLTLLNEREFDNGAGRQRCPLVSVIGATNEVPEKEVSEAFLDRFLLRLPVRAVSVAGFARLMGLDGADAWQAPSADMTLGDEDRAALANAAAHIVLPAEVLSVMAELHGQPREGGESVSDRRWVKILRFLRIAAAAEGRRELALWDLLLLPWLMAPDADGQTALNNWLHARLGVAAAFSPARLTRVVEAFEAQLKAELEANDLDYDESGRLKLSVNEMTDTIGDAKGGARALRLHHSRSRRYGETHIGARLSQIDSLAERIGAYRNDLAACLDNLKNYRATSLWLDDDALAPIENALLGTAEALLHLAERTAQARAGFRDLPRLPEDNGQVPEPVEHETLDAA